MSELADLVRSSAPVLVLAGGALAAESGIPEQPPSIDWDVYGPRMRTIWEARPSAGHEALRRMQDGGWLKAVISDSDDVLLDEAGVRDVVEMRGSVEVSICPSCRYTEPLGCLLEILPQPRCAACGGLLRPDVRLADQPPADEALARARALVGAARLLIVVGPEPSAGPGAALCALAREAGGHVAVLDREPPARALARLADALTAA
jgi:NAD-dependent deacetylase